MYQKRAEYPKKLNEKGVTFNNRKIAQRRERQEIRREPDKNPRKQRRFPSRNKYYESKVEPL